MLPPTNPFSGSTKPRLDTLFPHDTGRGALWSLGLKHFTLLVNRASLTHVLAASIPNQFHFREL